jgi:cysteine synthase A
MFRTAARGFAASAWRAADAHQQTAINISKAQGIGHRGFLDGTPLLLLAAAFLR